MSCGRATRRRSMTRRTSCRASQARWNSSTALPWRSRNWPRRPPGTQGSLPAHRPSRLQTPDRRTGAGRHRHAHGVRSRPSARRPRSRPRRDRGDHRVAQKRGHLSASGAPPRRRLHRRLQPAPDGVRTPPRPPGPSPTTLQPVHPLADAGTRRARSQHLGAATRRSRRHQGNRATDRHPRPRQPTAARQRHHLQLPPAPAALRTHRARKRRITGPRTPARRPEQPSGSRSPSQSSQVSRRLSRGATMRRRSSSSNSSVEARARASSQEATRLIAMPARSGTMPNGSSSCSITASSQQINQARAELKAVSK